MKNIILIILLITSFANAQEKQKEIFTLKPSLGINGCQIHGDGYSGYNKAGIFAGAALNALLDTKTSVEMGFYLSQKGARHNPNPSKNDYSWYLVNLNYLDLPLSVKYYLNKDYFVTGGPSIAYLISYYEATERGNWTGVYPFAKFEYGLNFGMGKKIKDKFFFEVRSSNSVVPVRSYGVIANLVFYPNPIARFFNKGFYNNILTFFVSYKIEVKRKISNYEE